MKENLYHNIATVKRVVDADTFDLEIDVGFHTKRLIRVRLKGVDTPEIYGVKKESEEWKEGKAVSDYVKDRIEHQKVIVKTYKNRKGKYGRYLGVVYYGENFEICLNDELKEMGYIYD